MNKNKSRKRPQTMKSYESKSMGKRTRMGAEPRGPRYNRAAENRGW